MLSGKTMTPISKKYAMHFSFLSIANFLVTVFVKSEKALLDKYEKLDDIHRCQIL